MCQAGPRGRPNREIAWHTERLLLHVRDTNSERSPSSNAKSNLHVTAIVRTRQCHLRPYNCEEEVKFQIYNLKAFLGYWKFCCDCCSLQNRRFFFVCLLFFFGIFQASECCKREPGVETRDGGRRGKKYLKNLIFNLYFLKCTAAGY